MNKSAQGTSDTGKPSGPALVGSADPEDALLVERSIAGEGTAFEQLFLKYRQPLFAVAWRLLRDEDTALDVVQDAFIRSYEQLERLRGEARFFPWLRRIAVNLAIDRLRRQKHGVEVALEEIGAAGRDEVSQEAQRLRGNSNADSPAEKAELSELSSALSEALLKLSERHRAVFILHATEGMSYKEIADALDCNIGTVMSRLFYARKRLQELLAPHLAG